MLRLLSAIFPLLLLSCNTPQTIPDGLVSAWEYPEGGAIACTSVHTVFTDIPPVHNNLDTCENMLTGSVFMPGQYFGQIIEIVDTMCTEAGDCSYQQEQAASQLKSMLLQVKKIIPKRKK